jgi:hypothetical protein
MAVCHRTVQSAPGTVTEPGCRGPVAARRRQLYLLDGCLELLEDAQERGDRLVSTSLAARLEPFLPGVRQDMQILDAIELAFDEQEHHLTDWRTLVAMSGDR